MSAGFCTLNNVIAVADGRSKYLCFITLNGENSCNLPDQLHALPAAIVNTPDKRREISGARFGRQNSLPRAENQRTIGSNAVVGKPFNGFNTIFYHGYFYNNIWVNGRQLFSFVNYGLHVGTDYFSADVTIYHFTNCFIMFHYSFGAFNAFFCHQRRVGGYAV